MSALDTGGIGPVTDRPAVADRLVGRYAVGRRRARGPATDTHPGWDHHLDRPVTIELYRPTARPAHRYRREREVAALADLHHPAVLTVHDRGRDPATGLAYVVTEPLDGITLDERIRRGPQSLVRVLSLGATLASALAHLHAADLVHRRLTPSTITMDRRRGPVLHDLDGVATLDVEAVTLEEAVALPDAVYLAPEQIAGREVGPTADVYSLARILEACLAARATHARAQPGAPATRTPASVRAVLAAMTDPDPERRLGAARVIDELDALARAVTGEPAGAELASAEPTTVRPAASDLAAAGSPIDEPAARGVVNRGPAVARAPGLPCPSRPSRRRAALVAALVLGLGIEMAALGAAIGTASHAPPHEPPAATSTR